MLNKDICTSVQWVKIFSEKSKTTSLECSRYVCIKSIKSESWIDWRLWPLILSAFVTTEYSDFSAVNMGSSFINVIIFICIYNSIIGENNAVINKWLDDSCYFPGENFGYSISFSGTARPRDTRFLVPEKNRAAQNRASWGLYLCTKVIFFSKNRVTSRLLSKNRVLQVFLLTNSCALKKGLLCF